MARGKRWYSDCVRHFLAFYVSTMEIGTQPKFKNEAEKTNWVSCHVVVSKLSTHDQELVREIYGQGDTIADNIYRMSIAKRMSQGPLWNLVDTLEYEIAGARGLI